MSQTILKDYGSKDRLDGLKIFFLDDNAYPTIGNKLSKILDRSIRI